MNLYGFVENGTPNYYDYLGQSKGGKQNISVNHKGEVLNKTTPLKRIEDAILEAIDDKMSKKHLDKLKGLRKVVGRGGTLSIAIMILEPVEANASEELLLDWWDTLDFKCRLVAGPVSSGTDDWMCRYNCRTKDEARNLVISWSRREVTLESSCEACPSAEAVANKEVESQETWGELF